MGKQETSSLGRRLTKDWLSWLIVLSATSALVLVFIFTDIDQVLDFRQWSRLQLFIVNLAVVIVLVLIRFGSVPFRNCRRSKIKFAEVDVSDSEVSS